MERRNFLKLASCVGLSVVGPAGVAIGRELGSRPRTAADAYAGNFFLCVNAAGGWDPTSLCDPKGAKSDTDPDPMNQSYLASAIEEAGNIRYAPVGYNQTFFQKYYDRLLVINGIDMQTNGHDAGSRHAWSGRLAEGHPCLAAYFAGTYDPAQPMAFLSYGGYSITSGAVPRTRAGNLGVLADLAYPTRVIPDDETSTFHSERALELIDEAQRGRDQALANAQGLPKIRNSINTLYSARSGSNELKRLQQYLPEQMVDNRVGRQAQVALAAYKAGISISANLNIGGFDTHGNHDASHIPRLAELLEGVDIAIQEAERLGVADKLVVVIASDFGRTPGYNDGNGKDHWSISSMMLMGPGIEGNRVIGETDEGHNAFGVDPATLAIDRSDDPSVKILPGHVHQALRDKYGMGDANPLAAEFPISINERLPLF